MKLKREKKKPKFWEYILFSPEAFKIVFYMSIIMGILISAALVASAFIFDWATELKVIFSIVTAFNIYNSIKYLKAAYSTTFTINDMVYNNKFKPKKEVKK